MLQLSAPAIVCVTRIHGETGVIARLLTEQHGLIAAYVAGGRGRNLRPVLIPGNLVAAEFTARSESQLPSARLELVQSRGPWLGEPLASTAIGWCTSLAAAALPERQAHPALFTALAAVLDAVCHAPSARGWAAALAGYEALLLREMGYDAVPVRPDPDDFPAVLAMLDQLAPQIARHALAPHGSASAGLASARADVMGGRAKSCAKGSAGSVEREFP
jgi:DNA repair protein RecO (recombination protein O)